MSFVTGRIGPDGAVIDVQVDVSRPRHRLLRKHHLAVPESVHVRAQIDTGASISGFSPRVFRSLDMPAVGKISVMTPSTLPGAPHQCDLYDVHLSVIAGGRAVAFPDCRVAETDCWLDSEGIEALIGRDILDHCFFQYVGFDGTFTLALQN